MIVVTGGLGFIGSAVVQQLVSRGLQVRIVDDLSKGQTPAANAEHEFMRADLRDPDAAERVLKDADVCYHLAAKIGGIGYFHKYPATILNDNGLMLSSVFDAARKHGTKVVYISSSMVYERA